MVLGLSAKAKKGASLQVNYLIHIQEIKPWPPSQSLRSLRSVLIQWEGGGRCSGSTNTVVPSLGSIVGEGKIEFNESFKLPVILVRDMSAKGKDGDTFQKNCVEFNLCEPRRDKMQLLATALIDLADYGVIKEPMFISVPVNSKRSFRNTSEPMLYIKVQPIGKGSSGSSSRDGLAKVSSLDKNGESVSALMNEEYAEEAEVSSFTDDDVSSHSSLTNGSLAPQNGENGTESKGMVSKDHKVGQKLDPQNDISPPENSDEAQCVHSSSPYTSEDKREEANTITLSERQLDIVLEAHDKVPSIKSIAEVDTEQDSKQNVTGYFPDECENPSASNLSFTNSGDLPVNEADCGKYGGAGKCSLKDTPQESINISSSQDMIEKEPHENESRTLVDTLAQVSTRCDGSPMSNSLSSTTETGMKENLPKTDRLKLVKSVRSQSDSVRSSKFVSKSQHNEVTEFAASGEIDNSAGKFKVTERVNSKVYQTNTRTTNMDNRIQKLEYKIKMLEGELREAAAIEAALYAVVAEHGSSMSKVHAPARRLARLYLHTYKEYSQTRRATAARSAVSGLVLVAKACGNDVPRLTFWLSNCVVLRTIICQAISDEVLRLPTRPHKDKNVVTERKNNKSTSLNLKISASQMENKNEAYGDIGDWEDTRKLVLALEKVEAWIFTRIVESIWWQTLTPHMQSAATRSINILLAAGSKKNLRRTSSSCDENQVNFSQGLWKKAFKDACERLCPVRAAGHECGCLRVLARLIMEQCVARLDIAMFNAILRESADDIPTDPVSDPISDSKVLPIPAGRSSFGAGAQLKTAIGNWSRWLTDLFGMDDDDLLEEEKDEDNEREDSSFKSFHLLNALSDLMMLPKDMLLSNSVRKEVCPQFGSELIKKVLDVFVTDEFCPDPIPDIVLEALDSVDTTESGEDYITTIPCTAAPPRYLPPSAASVAVIIGEFGGQPQLRSGSSVVRKSYTSDDELDELNSPLTSIFFEKSLPSPGFTKLSWKSKEKGSPSAIRYELLRDIWMKSE